MKINKIQKPRAAKREHVVFVKSCGAMGYAPQENRLTYTILVEELHRLTLTNISVSVYECLSKNVVHIEATLTCTFIVSSDIKYALVSSIREITHEVSTHSSDCLTLRYYDCAYMSR